MNDRLPGTAPLIRPMAIWPVGVPLLLACACGGGDSRSADERYPFAAAQDVDARGLEQARTALPDNPHTRCLLVERNGVVVMEEYFGGATAASFFDVRSVTKSILSLLVGQALRDGHIQSIDQTIGDFLDPMLPGLPNEKRAISIRQLLTMTSGLPWKEIGSTEQDFGAWVSSADQLRWILDKPFESTPGQRWHYNNAACHILSPILTVATGTPTRDLAQRNLFSPLGCEIGAWPTDSRGYAHGGHAICLTAPTMARIGRLALDGGAWQGRQLVPREWIDASTSTKVATEGGIPWGTGYAYLWWTATDPRTGLSFYYANGYGGQFIVNVPARNATIVAATAWSGLPGATANANWSQVLGTIVQQIFPALQ